jgi:hypothetical protein
MPGFFPLRTAGRCERSKIEWSGDETRTRHFSEQNGEQYEQRFHSSGHLPSFQAGQKKSIQGDGPDTGGFSSRRKSQGSSDGRWGKTIFPFQEHLYPARRNLSLQLPLFIFPVISFHRQSCVEFTIRREVGLQQRDNHRGTRQGYPRIQSLNFNPGGFRI